MIDEYLDKNDLDINDPATIARFDGMYVDFYLEDDMFEIEGKFFTIDNQLYIEVHDAVMHPRNGRQGAAPRAGWSGVYCNKT